jgi:hypothetical protein
MMIDLHRDYHECSRTIRTIDHAKWNDFWLFLGFVLVTNRVA